MKKTFFVFVFVLSFSSLVLTTACAFAQMLDRSDSRVQTTFSPGADWNVLGTVRPKSASEITAGQNWTLGCETLDRDYIFWDTYKEYVAPLGIRRIRLQAGWAKTEKEKGVYDFAWLDAIINDALARGLEIWLETDYGNPIYPGGGGWDLGAGFPVSEEALAAWDRWVEALATRYKGKVRDFAMWNEPDSKKSELIALFNIRTAEIILRVNPDARIGALSLASNNPMKVKECLDVFEREGKMHLFTWLIYHGYALNPDTSYQRVSKLQEIVDSYPHKLKLWQGENGCPSEMAHKFALSNHPWSELTQAKWDSRRMLGDLGHDVISSVFTICDFDHSGREINRKGLLKINDKNSLAKVKMAYYTVQNIASLFDLSLERQKEYAANVPDENVTWYAFRDAAKKQDLLVFWDGTQIPSESNETRAVTWTLENAQIADPVLVDVLTGRIYEIPAKNIQRDGETLTLTEIPVYDAPLVITDRARVL